jgi:hypothetical protein
MPFPTEFPKEAVGVLLHAKDQDTAHIALAGYELVGFGLGLVFGDVKPLASLDFSSMTTLAEGADAATKITARAKELKKSGLATFAIILKLLAEFGPVVLDLVNKIKDLLKSKE